MKKVQREDLYIISRHSDLTANGLAKVLKENIYNDRENWQKSLSVFFISLGIGFMIAGIVFFFAYNWADMHKFAKIGLIEGLLVIATGFVLFLKVRENIKGIILTGTAVLVGVLFAVFGQIYQTGADAYDFFFVWTLFVSLWVFFSDFAPLWLLYLGLVNATLILYAKQIAEDWSGVFVCALLFIVNSATLISSIIISRYKKTTNVPVWFLYTVAFAAVGCATWGICLGILGDNQPAFPLLLLITSIVFAIGIWYGINARNGFFPSVISFSLIVMVSACLIRISHEEVMFFVTGLFIISSVTLVIKKLIAIQKKWANED